MRGRSIIHCRLMSRFFDTRIVWSLCSVERTISRSTRHSLIWETMTFESQSQNRSVMQKAGSMAALSAEAVCHVSALVVECGSKALR
jgi:hypothetical protein